MVSLIMTILPHNQSLMIYIGMSKVHQYLEGAGAGGGGGRGGFGRIKTHWFVSRKDNTPAVYT